jgi:hypothetical protein
MNGIYIRKGEIHVWWTNPIIIFNMNIEFSVFLQYKKVKGQIYLVWFMVFNTIFKNISVIS